jgi:hypothetical protein
LIYNFLDTDLIYNCVGMLSGVAFNKINNIEFDQMIEAAGRFGRGGKKTKPTSVEGGIVV